MTKAYFSEEGFRKHIRVEGHAATPTKCAAVSTLLYTLAGYLHNIPCRIEKEKLDEGDAELIFRGMRREVKFAYDLTLIGFLQLEKTFPDEFKIIF